MVQETIDYWELLTAIDTELARIGWSTNRARLYIYATYGKRSRHQMSDGQLIEFWEFLKAFP
ncbi:hypothetical protein [Stanieria cyanosphaera]|uniref:hypothetical protein n=1 Tax=Stanieria cyanosphaera TaxID=102116 RepID=UPI0005A179F4|nr:hypothetical protein [Stanieria cyanosphaera]